MVAGVFSVPPEGIVHNQGGNEFDSALAAALFLRDAGASPKAIVAVVAAIAATIPFREAIGSDERGAMTDGHMGVLAHRVKAAELYGYSPDWQDVNDIMHLSVHLANRDIAPFIRADNFAQVVHNGRLVRKEELPEFRQQIKTIGELAVAAGRERSAPLLYEWLGSKTGPVPATNVPHVYIPRSRDGVISNPEQAYPPLPVYYEAVQLTENNARMASLFFKAHEAGIMLAASLAAVMGEPDAPVPGFVHARLWSPQTIPKTQGVELTAEEREVFAALMYGRGQADIDSATPIRSPIGSMLLGALGTTGIGHLSRLIDRMRALPEPGRKTIILELQRVARYYAADPERGNPHREERLGAVGRVVVEVVQEAV
jgi:hypothetical protein